MLGSFVKSDLTTLSKNYEVTTYFFKPTDKYFLLFIRLVFQFFYLLINIHKFKYIYIWFADYHSVLPVFFAKVFRKKSFVVNGGYDVNSVPEFKYGIDKTKKRLMQNKWIFRNATMCLPVAKSLKTKINSLAPKAKVIVIPTGVDYNIFTFSNYKREKTVITIAGGTTRQRFFIKGLDRFNELAVHMPDYKFIVLGMEKDIYSRYIKPAKNLEIVGFIKKQSDFINAIQYSSFYAQFSRSEGLPTALLEAMLCGCIPLGIDVGDIKRVASGIGFVSEKWDTDLYRDFIINNHNNKEFRDKARKRIIDNFTIEKRGKLLTNIIS